MGRIKNDEARNDEKKIDATAAVRQGEGDGALGNLEAVRCDAQGMKGDDRNSSEKPENLDMDKHSVSLACDERRLKQKSRHRFQAARGAVPRVAALRLTPVGGEEAIFGRTGSSARGAFVGARLGWRATLFGAAAMSVAALAVTINERTNTQKICPRTLIAAAFLYSKTHKLK
jgi:hypothetical protein